MVLRRDRGLVQAFRIRRKNTEQEAPDASRNNRGGPERRKRSHDWKLGTWNCKSLGSLGSTRILSEQLRVREFGIVALQEVFWRGKDYRKYGDYTIFWSCKEKKRELGTAFIVMGEMQDRFCLIQEYGHPQYLLPTQPPR